MSTLQAANLKNASSVTNNIVLDTSGNTTISGNAVISGSATVGGVAVVTTTGTQTLTNKTLTSPTITGAVMSSMASSVLTLDTAKTATGAFVDFTGIPSWARRITVIFNGVSTNGTSPPLIQLGAGSVTSSGYVSAASSSDGTTVSTSTAGFIIRSAAATNALTGPLTISTMGSNIWVVAGLIYNSAVGGVTTTTTGGVTLGGTADRVRITTVNGTDLFDAGTINVMWE